MRKTSSGAGVAELQQQLRESERKRKEQVRIANMRYAIVLEQFNAQTQAIEKQVCKIHTIIFFCSNQATV